jgi:hypothetical protein
MNKEKLISILYGEGDASTLNSAEQKELGELKKMRQFLQQHQDTHPQVVPVTVAKRDPFYRSKWWAIAASLLILLVAGKWLDLNITWNKQALAIQFGHPEGGPQNAELKQLVTQEVESQRAEMYQKWDHFQKKVGMTLANLEAVYQNPNSTPPQPSSIDRTMLASFQATMEKDNQQFKNELFETLRLQNEISSEALIQNIVDYIDASREEDFRLVSKNLQDLAQAIEIGNEAYAQYVNQPVQNL